MRVLCFKIEFMGWNYGSKWKRSAKAGDKLAAVIEYRKQHDIPLKQAKEAVEAYLKKIGAKS